MCLIGSESHTEEVDLLVMIKVLVIKVLVAALVKIFGHSLGDFFFFVHRFSEGSLHH